MLVLVLFVANAEGAITLGNASANTASCTNFDYPSEECCKLLKEPIICAVGDQCSTIVRMSNYARDNCRQKKFSSPKVEPPLPAWFNMALVVFLIAFSALFSGLTLGLMGLDKVGLQIVLGAGSMQDATDLQKYHAECAKKIQPVRENGNRLLCTLLLGNVAVNAMLSILMADMTSGLMGFLISTLVIVIFGEITPQAICARYALAIGANAIPVVMVFQLLLSPITIPIAKMLDCMLGEEIGSIHSTAELVNLLRIHVDHDAVDEEQGDIMIGAVTYKDKKIHEVMTPLDRGE
jgi:CBS domain containing-hemolysin-like protein